MIAGTSRGPQSSQPGVMPRGINTPVEGPSDPLDSITENIGTIVKEQQSRPEPSGGIPEEDCAMTERKKRFMREIAMRHD